jgi:hypothetical protein
VNAGDKKRLAKFRIERKKGELRRARAAGAFVPGTHNLKPSTKPWKDDK